jgi:hypothetical protein
MEADKAWQEYEDLMALVLRLLKQYDLECDLAVADEDFIKAAMAWCAERRQSLPPRQLGEGVKA